MSEIANYMRLKNRISVLRGHAGQGSGNNTALAKPKDGENIKEGMLISLDSNGEWVKGCPAGKTPYWANADQDYADVVSSKRLLGYSARGNYELEVGYYKSADVYTIDTQLVPDGTTGNVKKATANGEVLVGVVTRVPYVGVSGNVKEQNVIAFVPSVGLTTGF